VVGAVIVFHDVAQSRVVAERMAHLARHDYLTGLPNPALLTERLSQAMSLAHRHSKRVALLFLDLNDFKSINDTFGHLVGDRFLQAVATRLTGCVRASDTVCRRGGDEFVILLTEIESSQDAAQVAEKVLATVSAPQVIDGIHLQRTASLGISIYPEDGKESAALIQRADSAMYDAKASEPGGYRFFGSGTASPRARAAILNDPELEVVEVNVEAFEVVGQSSAFVSSCAASDTVVARGVDGVKSVTNPMQVK
jgi:diguanylate cyclase (GGDEF)-like protein